MIKVFISQDDKIHLTEKEMETLLKEAYNEGYADGKKSINFNPPINVPSIWPTTPTCEPDVITTTTTGKPLEIKYEDLNKKLKSKRR